MQIHNVCVCVCTHTHTRKCTNITSSSKALPLQRMSGNVFSARKLFPSINPSCQGLPRRTKQAGVPLNAELPTPRKDEGWTASLAAPDDCCFAMGFSPFLSSHRAGHRCRSRCMFREIATSGGAFSKYENTGLGLSFMPAVDYEQTDTRR